MTVIVLLTKALARGGKTRETFRRIEERRVGADVERHTHALTGSVQRSLDAMVAGFSDHDGCGIESADRALEFLRDAAAVAGIIQLPVNRVKPFRDQSRVGMSHRTEKQRQTQFVLRDEGEADGGLVSNLDFRLVSPPR